MIKINVAIIGAGLAGLSSALILEKEKINHTIFEKRSKVGDRFVNCEILLSLLSQEIDDPIKYLANKYQIYLQAENNIAKLILHSQNETAVIEGNLGFTNLRGRAKNSFEKQLEKQIKGKIIFNSKKSYQDLLQEYTHIILATGDAAYAKKLKNYTLARTVTIKGAIVKGKFDAHTVQTWLNNDLAPKGYAYLIPLNQKEGNISIAYPEFPENLTLDPEVLWDNFYQEVSNKLEQKLKIKSHFHVHNYLIGLCNSARLGNTFFVGNNYGSIMPFLGFGQIEAILTGIYAALDICGLGNYEKLCQELEKSYHNSLTLRKTFEKLNNTKYDLLVKSLQGSLGNKLFQAKHNYLKVISKILKPLV